MEVAFEPCCRLCLADNSSYTDVFQLQNGFKAADLIKELCQVEIEANDSLPKEICFECLDVVTMAHNLRITSQKNDRLLRGEEEGILVKEEIIQYEPEPAYDIVELGYFEDENSYNCDKCSVVKSTKEEIFMHIQETHLFICSICSKKCKTEFSLSQHNSRLHNGEERISVFSCDFCKTSFKTARRLEKHKQIHTYYDEIVDEASLVYKCRVENCAKSFENYSEKLFQHISYHERHDRSIISTEANVCPHCGQTYKSKQILQQHIKRHFDTGERYPCPSCPQKFKSW